MLRERCRSAPAGEATRGGAHHKRPSPDDCVAASRGPASRGQATRAQVAGADMTRSGPSVSSDPLAGHRVAKLPRADQPAGRDAAAEPVGARRGSARRRRPSRRPSRTDRRRLKAHSSWRGLLASPAKTDAQRGRANTAQRGFAPHAARRRETLLATTRSPAQLQSTLPRRRLCARKAQRRGQPRAG